MIRQDDYVVVRDHCRIMVARVEEVVVRDNPFRWEVKLVPPEIEFNEIDPLKGTGRFYIAHHNDFFVDVYGGRYVGYGLNLRFISFEPTKPPNCLTRRE